jgi:hypothetical protein
VAIVALLLTAAWAAPAQSEQAGDVVPAAQPPAHGSQSSRADELLAAAKAALNGGGGMREIEIVTRDPQGKEKVWRGRQAIRASEGKREILLVLDDPASVRGFAVLARSGTDATHEMWAYTPPVERVRKLELTGMAQPFLGTDLTFADLGLVDLAGTQARIKGSEDIDGSKVAVVETTPPEQRAYARILTYVTEDGKPVRREYRDVADRLWRVVEYETAPRPDGRAVVSALRARDVQTGYTTELRYLGPASNAEVPADLFDPAGLARVAEERRLHSSREDVLETDAR